MPHYPLFPSRPTICLDGLWDFAFFPGKKLEDFPAPDFAPTDRMLVPACFDATPAYYCQRGTARYRRAFTLGAPAPRAVLKLGGLGLRARFWLDGRELGVVELPYSGVELPIDQPLAAGAHVLTAAVDNCFDAEKMPIFLPYYDFFAFGGFYRGAALQTLPAAYNLQRVQVRTRDFRKGEVSLRFLFQGAAPATARATVRFNTEAAPREVSLTVKDGAAEMTATVPNFRPWSPASPALHTVEARLLDNGDAVVERFGVREISAGKKTLLLNGEPLYLKGFNRHESHPQCGAATSETMMLEDLQNLRGMGCNFVRGCHYPQDQRFLDLCDEFGILVWEESLGWGNTKEQMAAPKFRAMQEAQTRLMVRNSVNHPAVVIWAFLNECDSASPAGKELCAQLRDAIKAEDDSRLVTFACNHTGDDVCAEMMDFIAYNTYPGWCDNNYDDDPMGKLAPDMGRIVRFFRGKRPDAPLMVSEMGTCGIYGEHDRAGAQWTEEFEAEYLDTLAAAVLGNPELCGLTIWQLNDAKSFLRHGANIRCKPLALNLAGAFDQFRRPKLASEVMRRHFTAKG